jgi:hypothetical protein
LNALIAHGRWSVEYQWSNFSRNGATTTARTIKKVAGMDGSQPYFVIAGLDPAIHENAQRVLFYVRQFYAERHHGCPGQARA